MTDPHDPASLPAPLAEGVGRNWRGFLELCEPLRPELYRYSRYLTRSPWEADDLVQDTLMRAFVALGCVHQEIRNPRAWLLRIASNLWLNRVRDARELPSESSALPEPSADSQRVDPQATREAAGSLLVRLAPQERAAVVLKDVFELSLEDTAEALSTSVGAVKAALQRGRGKLSQPEPGLVAGGSACQQVQEAPAPAVLEAFCAAFNARDLERVTALLLDHAINEFPGLSLEYGAEAAKRGSLAGVLFGDPSSDRSGIAPQFRRGLLASPPRLELRMHRGEGLLLAWFAHDDGEAVRGISRVSVVGDRIAHMRTYLHQPEVLAELCAELAVPFRSNGCHYWW
jgi:RNA polymerase sigma-70 factor (ECF subfamily)